MQSPVRLCTAIAAVILLSAFAPVASAQEDYASWEPLQSEFPSTGGGGIIIKGYNPVIVGSKCSTNFTATEPNGTIYYNVVEFDAVPVQGGTLCTNGAWRAVDGSSSGTTPFRMFFKDGVFRRAP